MAPEYGDTPPWHDVMAAISGPAVHDVETVFRERWEDPTRLTRHPVYWTQDKILRLDMSPDPLAGAVAAAALAEDATHTVQLLRTYPNLRRGRDYPFARGGERSVARGYSKALSQGSRPRLRRGPVRLGRAGRRGLHRGTAAPPGPARRGRRTPLHRPGRLPGAGAAEGRPGSRDAGR